MWRNQTYRSDDSGLSFGEKCRWHTTASVYGMSEMPKFSNSIRTSLCPTRCGLNCDMSTPKYHYPLGFLRPDIHHSLFHQRLDGGTQRPSAPDFAFSRTPPTPYTTDRHELNSQSGHTGNRFFTYPQFGHTSKIESTSALCDYTNNYQFTKKMEFTPLPFYHASLYSERTGSEIYPRNTAIVPSFKGHVPGMQHSYGKTFGNQSVNAKRYLNNSTVCMH